MKPFDDATLDTMRREADPEADAVVADHFAAEGSSASDLFLRLVRHPDHPETGQPGGVSAYLDERPDWPDWADPDLVERGQLFFESWGPQILQAMLLASLPRAYAAAKGVQVLALTARMATDPRRRLIETMQLGGDAMRVGGLDPGAAGYEGFRKVRLMHAAVRYLIAHDPYVIHGRSDSAPTMDQWCDDWGVPINQEDLLGTFATFTTVILDALDRLGVQVSEADAEAHLHVWSLAMYLLGIRPDLLPLDVGQMRQAQAIIERRQFAPSVAGRYLTQALVGLTEEQMRPRVLSGFPHTVMRYLVGEEVAGLLAIPPSNWSRVLLGPCRRLLAAVSRTDIHDKLMRSLTFQMNRATLTATVDIERVGDRARFAIPEHLADAWSVPAARVSDQTSTSNKL